MTHILIDNPHKKDPKELIEIAQCLMRMAGATMVKAPNIGDGPGKYSHETSYLFGGGFDPNKKETIPLHTHSPVSDLDSAGVEWNAQIHSARRTKTVDGLWRARRYSSQGVEIEEDEEPVSDFQKFMSFVVGNSDKITPEYLMQVLQDLGIESVVGVQEFPQHIPRIMHMLQARVSA